MILVAIALLTIAVFAGPAALVVTSLLMPAYLSFLSWLATSAGDEVKKKICKYATYIGLFYVVGWIRKVSELIAIVFGSTMVVEVDICSRIT